MTHEIKCLLYKFLFLGAGMLLLTIPPLSWIQRNTWGRFYDWIENSIGLGPTARIAIIHAIGWLYYVLFVLECPPW